MNKFKRISCHHFVEYNGYAYFSNWFYNGLFQVELNTGKTRFLGSFENETHIEHNLHYEVVRQGDMIYFFPRRGRNVHIYSIGVQSTSYIEVRRASERFFRIGEVIIGENDIVLLPMERWATTKRLNLRTHVITDIKGVKNKFEGTYLSQSWPSFPMPELLEKYQIEKAERISWKHMPDGRWCAFLPMGRHLLWYTPETQKIETVPLTVVNKEELNVYLNLIKKECFYQKNLIENQDLSFRDYLNVVIGVSEDEMDKHKNEKRSSAGEKIWGGINDHD